MAMATIQSSAAVILQLSCAAEQSATFRSCPGAKNIMCTHDGKVLSATAVTITW